MNLERLITEAASLRLTTERLGLRRMTEDDRETAIAHELDRDIMRWIRDPLPVKDVEQRVDSTIVPWQGKDGQWLILAAHPHTAAQMTGIVCCRVMTAETETIEIGYRFHPDVHRKGFGFEACRAWVNYLFGEIEARKLTAFCVSDNEASWRLLQKIGMRREATFREHEHLNGAFRDEYGYGMLRREWSNADSAPSS